MSQSCSSCQKKPVWKFTNKSQLCKGHFIQYFERKVMQTIRRFQLFSNEDILGITKKENPALIYLIKKIAKSRNIPLIELSSLNNKKITKIIVSSSLDTEAFSILFSFMSNLSELKKQAPKIKQGKIELIKPFYLMSEKEIMLYSKLLGLKYKKNKDSQIRRFLEGIDSTGESMNAVVNSYLELENKA